VIARLALTALGICATTARADPQIHAERCPILPAAALAAAIARELALAPTLASHAASWRIDLDCPDAIHARVQIEPGPTREPVTVDLDLSEEPDALRVKLVAVAVAELANLVDVAHEPAAMPSTPAIDPEDAPPPVLGAVATPSMPPRSPGVSVRGGLRIIAGHAEPMPTVSADLEVGPVRLGLVTAIGSAHRSEGTPYILALTVGRTLGCSRGRTSLCLVVRGEAGFVGAEIRLDDTAIMERNLYAGYGDLAVGFEVRRRLAGWNWIADVDLGAADGMVVEAQTLERLDGPFAVGAVGVSW